MSQDLYKHVYSVLHWMTEKEQQHLLPGGRMMLSPEEYTTRLDYYPVYSHKKADRRKIADITIGAHGIPGLKTVHRYLTLGLYPSQFKAGEFEHLQALLDLYLDDINYAKLYAYGKVNHLELASDTLTQKHHSFIAYRKYCSKSHIYKDDDGYLGTTYIGSLESDLFFRVYDKRKQLLDKQKPLITDSPVHTRIEVAMGRLKRSPASLIHMSNPFSKLQVTELEQAKALSDDQNWQNFLTACLTADGAPDALAALPAYTRTKYLGMLDDVPAWWWKPDLIWERLPEALARIAP
ncbi:MAG TPA: hypothetical protein PK974_01940 [Rhodocyclaceae bacterium]|nr:hypothetical protein [Rhodocyclaceae bacterium]